jgi:hypothetical protein
MDTRKNTSVAAASYERPALTELGTVHALTGAIDKKFGTSDGFTFMGISITYASA